jgi:uncharacterized tellurite resistance protein B-like protein
MIDRILQLLTGHAAEPGAGRPDELQLAVAALLVEAARMDDHFDASERAVIERLLAARFQLAPEATRRLLGAAERAAESSTQLFRFTHLAVQRLDAAERVRLIEMLWEVAYADGSLDPDEDALLRRIAGLLYVSDRERGEARQRALQRLGLKI